MYGINLVYREKKNYDVYLSAILREKILMDAGNLPDDIRDKASTAATDTALVNSSYRLSKRTYAPFYEVLADSLRRR